MLSLLQLSELRAQLTVWEENGSTSSGVRFRWFLYQKNSRRLELSISKNTPHGRWGQGPGSVDRRFPAGLPFPVPEIVEFVAFRDSGKFSSNFPGIFPEFSSRTPEQTPETATAFLSFSDSRARVSLYVNTIHHTNIVRTFYVSRTICLQKRVLSHTKLLHLHYSQEFHWIFFLHVILLGNKAHETSASRNHTLLDYTLDMFWGITYGQNYPQKAKNDTTFLAGIYLAIIS